MADYLFKKSKFIKPMKGQSNAKKLYRLAPLANKQKSDAGCIALSISGVKA
ncbi:hypothetical protein [Fibrella aquatilis]|uniref:Uncharacterized protein n=1 Tax=Fibrella aquatilis TaxID=2817059 RepID=A0A939G6L8_9BACT|nr:hypothetical protein [Fibrella aquatilis]MBO0933372.1 hypothetical protein [Fibrella aquatilis]